MVKASTSLQSALLVLVIFSFGLGTICQCEDEGTSTAVQVTMPSGKGPREYFDIIYKEVPFIKAISECTRLGGHLAEVYNQQERNELKKLAETKINGQQYKHKNFWVGGAALGQRGQAIWVTSGAPISPNVAKPGELSNANGTKTCGVFSFEKGPFGVALIGECESLRYFACKFN